MLVVCSGAMDDMYVKDQKKAVEMIVEQNAGKKLEEDSSADPKRKKQY